MKVETIDSAAAERTDDHAAKNLLECVHDCLASSDDHKTGRITGIGGVFFKSSSDQKALTDWYEKNLGMHIDERFGVGVLKWSEDKSEDGGLTVWEPQAKDSTLFGPSKSEFMINYRVDDIAKIFERLKKNGADIVKGPESHENGKFLWVMDPDGNKVELWEPLIWNDKNKQP